MAFEKPKFEEDESVQFENLNEEVKPENKKSAVIFTFPLTAKMNSEMEKMQNYGEYKILGGDLNQKQYNDVLKRVAEGGVTAYDSASSAQANFMAKTTGITLSPETLNIYKILRYEMPDRGIEPDRENKIEPEMSDQHLLAEALCITGDTHTLEVFMGKHPHIFI